MLVRRLRHLLLLQIVRNDDAGDGALRARDADGPIDEVPHLGGHHCRMHVFRGHILEERLQIDFLLVRAAHGHPRRLPDNGHHRLVIELGVIESVEKMNRSRS